LLHEIEQTARRRDDDVCSLLKRIALGPVADPPKMTTVFRSVKALNSLKAASTWRASSRVGSRIRQRIFPFDFSSRLRMGRPNAAVLPVPVCAEAIRSPPLRATGMACAWIGDGST